MRLTLNYRSTTQILACGGALLAGAPGVRKHLTAARPGAGAPVTLTRYDSLKDEEAGIAQEIQARGHMAADPGR